MPKDLDYTALILAKMQELFDDQQITLQELSEGDNCTSFFHALANLVPTSIYGRVTGEELNALEFNHVANKLCFQSMKPPKTNTDANNN